MVLMQPNLSQLIQGETLGHQNEWEILSFKLSFVEFISTNFHLGGDKRNIRGSTKSLGSILRGPQLSKGNCTKIHQKAIKMFLGQTLQTSAAVNLIKHLRNTQNAPMAFISCLDCQPENDFHKMTLMLKSTVWSDQAQLLFMIACCY